MTRWVHRNLPRALLRLRLRHVLRRPRGPLLWTTGTTANAVFCITPSGAFLLRRVVHFYSGVDNRRAYNIEPNMCWECYACVKACPQHAIDVRGCADFAPLGHSVRVRREEEKGTISWKLKFRDGREKNFVSPIRTTPWGSIKSPSDYEVPSPDALKTQELAHEPEALHIAALPTLSPHEE